NSSSVRVSTRLPSTNSVTLAYLLCYTLTERRVVLEFPPERQVLIVQCRQHTTGLDRHPLEVQHCVPSLDGSRVRGDNTSDRQPTVTDLYPLIRDGGAGLLCDALRLARSGLLQTVQDPIQRGPGHPQGVSHVTLAGTRAHERIVHRDALDVQG